MKILVSLTTTPDAHWREKIKEAKKLGLTEAAFFLTGLHQAERKEFFKRLKETKIKSAPFVHLRSDMSPEEIDYLIKHYGSKVFNIHSQQGFPLKHDLSRYRKLIYMENNWSPIIKEAGEWAGVCLDVSHHEDKRRLVKAAKVYRDLRQDVEKALDKYPIGVWHLNSVRDAAYFDHQENRYGHDYHNFEVLKEFDYCKRYKKYLPRHYIGLELENTLADQLRAKEYVAKILAS